MNEKKDRKEIKIEGKEIGHLQGYTNKKPIVIVL